MVAFRLHFLRAQPIPPGSQFKWKAPEGPHQARGGRQGGQSVARLRPVTPQCNHRWTQMNTDKDCSKPAVFTASSRSTDNDLRASGARPELTKELQGLADGTSIRLLENAVEELKAVSK